MCLTIDRRPLSRLHTPTSPKSRYHLIQNTRALCLSSSDFDAADGLLLDGCDARLAGAVKAMEMGPPVVVASGLGVRGCMY